MNVSSQLSACGVEEELFAYQKLRLGAAPAQNTVPPDRTST